MLKGRSVVVSEVTWSSIETSFVPVLREVPGCSTLQQFVLNMPIAMAEPLDH
jgi:hypothetical protein